MSFREILASSRTYLAAKFQTILGSFETPGTITGTGTSGTGSSSAVPEPNTLSLFAAALLAGLAYRRAIARAAQPVPVKV